MHAVINERGQIVIPTQARKEARLVRGDVVSVVPVGDGQILLVRLGTTERPKKRPIKIRYRKGTHAVASAGHPITSEQVRELLSDCCSTSSSF